jgi:hypothetical protein
MHGFILLGVMLLVLLSAYVFVTKANSYGAGVEQFIPIGKSPGVSGRFSVIGKITALVGPGPGEMGLIAVNDQGVVRWFRIAEDTPIYIDRSKVKQHNTIGTFTDLKLSLVVEVYPDPRKPGIAKWIKLEGVTTW